MKRCLMLILVVAIVFSFTAVSFAEETIPKIELKVVMDPAATTNVMYIAKLSGFTTANKIPVIDFYAGSASLTVYPYTYLGSAPVDNTGTAVLRVLQRPGMYAGGAIWVKSLTEKVFSNVVIYKVTY